MKKLQLIVIFGVGGLLFLNSCKKDALVTDSLYVPTASDVTSKATLTQLEQGRSIYINKCGTCHGLNSPDSYSAPNWSIILQSMAPRAGLSSADASLVLKYVSKGQ